MIKKYHFEQLICHQCAMEIVEKLEKMIHIKNVYIDFDNKDITIESDNELSDEEVKKIVDEIVKIEHFEHHTQYLESL